MEEACHRKKTSPQPVQVADAAFAYEVVKMEIQPTEAVRTWEVWQGCLVQPISFE